MAPLEQPRLTDAKILDLIIRGEVRVFVTPDDITVAKYHHGWKRMAILTPNYGDPGRVRFNLRVAGYGQRTIYRNRLVWLATRKQLVPDGYVINHIDTNSMNDQPTNLGLHTAHESNAQGNQLQHWNELVAYFDWIAFTGTEPCWA